MDFLSIIGIFIALLAILGGNWLEGGHVSSLLNGPAMAIVLGGTIGAILLQTPVPIFIEAFFLCGSQGQLWLLCYFNTGIGNGQR